MRVAVHFPEGHPLAGDDAPAVAAYALGRIEDGVHNAPPGHEPVALDDFLAGLLARAREEYPDAEVVLERLVENGDETARWIPAEDFDPDEHTPVGPGRQISWDLTASGKGRG